MRLRRDLVLVKLAPVAERVNGLILEPALPAPICYGKVVDRGSTVRDVKIGDIVTFGPSVGDPLDGMYPTPHLLVSEQDIDAVLEKEAV
jgi:hypothetical protein